MSAKKIDAVLRLKDEFSTPLRTSLKAMTDGSKQAMRLSKQVTRLGNSIKKAGTMLTASVTAPVAAAATASVKAAADFESAMATTSALSGTTGEKLEELADKARTAAQNSTYTSIEAADAYQYMALAGWKQEEMLEGIVPILNLAQAAEMDLASASDIVTDYLTAFGLTADDAGTLVDKMAYAMSSSNTNVEQLGEAYKNVAATSHQLGYSLDDTTAALMVMANSGIKGGEAGTALASIMTRLGNNVSKCRDLLTSYGVEVYDSNGKVKDLSDILDGMKGIWSGLTDEQKSNLSYVVAGKTAQSELMTLLGDTEDSLGTYKSGLENSTNAAQNMVDVLNNSFNAQLEITKGQLEDVGITLGQELLPYVQQALDYVQQAISAFANLSPQQQDQIVKIALIAAALGPVLMIVGSLLSTIGSLFTIINGAGAVFALLTGPIGIVLVSIGALIAIIVVLHENMDKIKAKIKEVKERFEEMAQKFKDYVAPNIQAVKDLFSGIVDVVGGAITAVKNFFTETDNAGTINVSANAKTTWDNYGGISVPKNAHGTNNWLGGLTQVSERGGEIIDLPSGSRIYPANQSERMMQSSNNTFSIAKLADSIIVREDADIDRIADALANRLTKVALNMA